MNGKTQTVLLLYLETGGGDLLGTLSKTHPQSKFTSGLVAAHLCKPGWVARLALPAWAEKQQSREDDRFALEKHRRPPRCMLTGLIGRHRRCMENRLARTGPPGLYHDNYARKRACSTSSHLTTASARQDKGTADQLRALLAASEPPNKRGAETAEELLFLWRPRSTSVHYRRLTSSLLAGVLRQT